MGTLSKLTPLLLGLLLLLFGRRPVVAAGQQPSQQQQVWCMISVSDLGAGPSKLDIRDEDNALDSFTIILDKSPPASDTPMRKLATGRKLTITKRKAVSLPTAGAAGTGQQQGQGQVRGQQTGMHRQPLILQAGGCTSFSLQRLAPATSMSALCACSGMASAQECHTAWVQHVRFGFTLQPLPPHLAATAGTTTRSQTQEGAVGSGGPGGSGSNPASPSTSSSYASAPGANVTGGSSGGGGGSSAPLGFHELECYDEGELMPTCYTSFTPVPEQLITQIDMCMCPPQPDAATAAGASGGAAAGTAAARSAGGLPVAAEVCKQRRM